MDQLKYEDFARGYYGVSFVNAPRMPGKGVLGARVHRVL